MDDRIDVPADASFGARVVALVRAIPEGEVATYGQIAALAGRPRAARVVGGILRHTSEDVPWHRVVNASGGISTFRIGAGDLQVALLQSEGIAVVDGHLDLAAHRWRPTIEGGEADVGGRGALR
jgi:methylated-DNA-protein-cysteine methyltransferase-like protein